MKNSSSIINILLAVAILVLYILHFTQKPSTSNTPEVTKADTTAKKPVPLTENKKEDKKTLTIGYVNVDSLDAKYEFSINARQTMQNKERALQSDLEKRASTLQNEMVNFQKTFNTMGMEQAKNKEQELVQKQQALEQYRQNVGAKYMQEEQDLQKKLLENISKFMKQYGEENGYDYILTYSSLASGTLYGNPEMDITSQVIEGLNRKYKESKK